jgi:hypothetical protein
MNDLIVGAEVPDVVINIEAIAMQSAEPPKRTSDLRVNYYPIECIESNRSIYGTVSYSYQGVVNRPNLTYVNPGETSPFGRNYISKELFVLPNRESFREFPFLANSKIPDATDGAIVIAHRAVTNSAEPIYMIFFLVNTAEGVHEEAQRQIVPLFDRSATGADGMKQIVQDEPRMLNMADFLDGIDADFDQESPAYSVHLNQIDHHGEKCMIAISPKMIPIPLPLPASCIADAELKKSKDPRDVPLPTTRLVHAPTMVQSTNVGSQILQEGFAATGDVGQDVSNLFGNMFSGMAADPKASTKSSGTKTATLKIPLKNDKNYSYQECTMVPVDDIDDNEYVYQISANSAMVSNKTVTIQGNLLTYLIIYFIAFLLTYFGVPFLYSFLMCTILKRGYNYTGYTVLIDYLKRPQNFLGFGKFSGLAVVFNVAYVLIVLSTLLYGSMTYGAFYLIMWIVGYIGISNNPVPDSCLYV